MRKFVSNNAEESKKIAQNFAEEILSGKIDGNFDGAVVVALIGDLGSGKTSFARVFARSLGVKDKVKSPTFIIFRKSEIPVSLVGKKNLFKYFYHFDFYRIYDKKEILNLNWEEIINNPQNIVLVEWADKIKKILPKDCVKIKFKHLMGNKRGITIS